MSRDETSAPVAEIMLDFGRLTGLAPRTRSRRYLWTDAFAVCNYLELFGRTGDKTYLDLGLQLVEQVHHILGRHRDDDPRRGWISGLDEQDAELHPTIGGLRIGKQMNERLPGERPDERLEWDRDGQYYHYLTKWMHALCCLAQVSGDPTHLAWAMELARTAHARFVYAPEPGGSKRMRWKMSIDLSRPLVSSMGQHDPLDGFVTYSELNAVAKRDFGESRLPDLGMEIAELKEICRGINLITDDPLGIGGLLFDASRLAQLMAQGSPGNEKLLEAVLDSARLGMRSFAREGTLRYPAEYRLAFRELGLSIGLSAAERLQTVIQEHPGLFRGSLPGLADDLLKYLPLRQNIEAFWMDGKNREAGTWIEHREINMVMLSTSLAPDRFLSI